MNALAIYAVNAHIADLLAEAQAERQARKARKARGRGPVASILAALRQAFEPQSLPKLRDYPYRS